MLVTFLSLATLSAPTALERTVEHFVPDRTISQGLITYAQRKARDTAERITPAEASIEGLESVFLTQVTRNLEEKMAIGDKAGRPFPISAHEIREQVIDFEAFRLETYLRSGVFPKRYFGFFDEKWDTQSYESTLRETVRQGVDVTNAYFAKSGSPLRVSDIEIAITFIAEGGADKLHFFQADLENWDTWIAIGLGNLYNYITDHPELTRQLDAALGTRMNEIVYWQNGQVYEGRKMYFKEVLAGIIHMYVFRKEAATKVLYAKHGIALSHLSMEEQFLFASTTHLTGEQDTRRMVVNPTGVSVLPPEDIARASRFDCLSLLLASQPVGTTARVDPIPVRDQSASLAFLLEEGIYPWQPPSGWNALYNALQRYGAMVAIQRFSSAFDGDGRYRDRAKKDADKPLANR